MSVYKFGDTLVHICSFDAVGDITNSMSYEQFKKLVLKAGRFSAFEATKNQRAQSLYSSLCADPEIETIIDSYPWTIVRKRV